MGRKYTPIQVVLHGPTTAEGRTELAGKIGEAHGDAAAQQIAKLNCPAAQKKHLLQEILDTAKE